MQLPFLQHLCYLCRDPPLLLAASPHPAEGVGVCAPRWPLLKSPSRGCARSTPPFGPCWAGMYSKEEGGGSGTQNLCNKNAPTSLS